MTGLDSLHFASSCRSKQSGIKRKDLHYQFIVEPQLKHNSHNGTLNHDSQDSKGTLQIWGPRITNIKMVTPSEVEPPIKEH